MNDPTSEHTQAHQRVLDELIAMAMDVARKVHAQIMAAEPALQAEPAPAPSPAPLSAPDYTIRFERVSQTVRRAILLSRHLEQPIQPRAAAPGSSDRPVENPVDRTAARKRIIRSVEDAIHDKADGPTAERLEAELLDRLDGPDLDGDILNRPVAEIIAEIRRDLGLADIPGARTYKRRTPADIAALHARAARLPASADISDPAPTSAPAATPPPSQPNPPERFFRQVAAPISA